LLGDPLPPMSALPLKLLSRVKMQNVTMGTSADIPQINEAAI
jgi:hypothetical protein